MKKHHYKADIRWSDEDAVFIARAPELEGVVTHGESLAEAAENLEEAIALHLESLEAHGEEIPEPISLDKVSGKFALRMSKERHQDLAIQARKAHLSMNEYLNTLIDAASSEGSLQTTASRLKAPSQSYEAKLRSRSAPNRTKGGHVSSKKKVNATSVSAKSLRPRAKSTVKRAT